MICMIISIINNGYENHQSNLHSNLRSFRYLLITWITNHHLQLWRAPTLLPSLSSCKGAPTKATAPSSFLTYRSTIKVLLMKKKHRSWCYFFLMLIAFDDYVLLYQLNALPKISSTTIGEYDRVGGVNVETIAVCWNQQQCQQQGRPTYWKNWQQGRHFCRATVKLKWHFTEITLLSSGNHSHQSLFEHLLFLFYCCFVLHVLFLQECNAEGVFFFFYTEESSTANLTSFRVPSLVVAFYPCFDLFFWFCLFGLFQVIFGFAWLIFRIVKGGCVTEYLWPSGLVVLVWEISGLF